MRVIGCVVTKPRMTIKWDDEYISFDIRTKDSKKLITVNVLRYLPVEHQVFAKFNYQDMIECSGGHFDGLNYYMTTPNCTVEHMSSSRNIVIGDFVSQIKRRAA